MSETSRPNVRAVERALQILTCFDDEHPERGITDIAQSVKLHKATTHRIVTTLMSFGFIERAEDGQRYRLGLRLADLGYKVIRRLDLQREAQPYMADLAHRLGETCDLGIYDRGGVLSIAVVQGNHTLTIAAAVGRSLPAHATASGKVLLAYMPEEVREVALGRVLAGFTEHTIASADRIRQELEIIRAQGYAIDDEEFEVGIRAISAPVCSREGGVVAAMSVAGPASRMSPERMSFVAHELVTAAQAVSHRMGCTGSNALESTPAQGTGATS